MQVGSWNNSSAITRSSSQTSPLFFRISNIIEVFQAPSLAPTLRLPVSSCREPGIWRFTIAKSPSLQPLRTSVYKSKAKSTKSRDSLYNNHAPGDHLIIFIGIGSDDFYLWSAAVNCGVGWGTSAAHTLSVQGPSQQWGTYSTSDVVQTKSIFSHLKKKKNFYSDCGENYQIIWSIL